jgi:putative FmdB family regulatory protein
MPSYDYECRECLRIHEQFHGMNDKPDRCPACGSRKVAKIHCRPPAISMPDMHWEGLNHGRGQWISGLGRRDDPKAYFRSRREAVEAAKRAGKAYELG